MITKTALDVLASILPAVSRAVNLTRPKTSTLFRTSTPNFSTAVGRDQSRQLLDQFAPWKSSTYKKMNSLKSREFIPNGLDFHTAFQQGIVK